MIVSFESGCDWTDASYSIMETDLTEAEMDAKREEWLRLYRHANQTHREQENIYLDAVEAARRRGQVYGGPKPARCDGYTLLGDFSTWLEKQGLVRHVEVTTYSDMD